MLVLGAFNRGAAKRRLADEYDAAQIRGEVASVGKPVNVPDGNNIPTADDLGLTRKDIHEARAAAKNSLPPPPIGGTFLAPAPGPTVGNGNDSPAPPQGRTSATSPVSLGHLVNEIAQ
jgi:hypothetical protein